VPAIPAAYATQDRPSTSSFRQLPALPREQANPTPTSASTNSALSLSLPSPRRRSVSFTSPLEQSKRVSRALSQEREDDRLRRELAEWSLGLDGILGGSGEDLKYISHLELGRRTEGSPVTSSPSASDSVTTPSRQDKVLPPITKRSPTTLDRLPNGRVDVTPTLPQRAASEPPASSKNGLSSPQDKEDDQTPSIRLVSPPVSPTGSDSGRVGLGLGLETISEAHSRSSSRDGSALQTSPSLSPSQYPVPSTPVKKGVRKSVVAYPLPAASSSSSLGIKSMVEDDADERAVEVAVRLWDEDESFLKREKIAQYLGSQCACIHFS
jgi:hypothetical protein